MTSVIDADGRVIEPDDLWSSYLDPGFLASAPRWVNDTQGRRRRISDMDRHGIETSVLFPSAGLHFASIPEAEVAIALCRVYNDWLADFCAADRSRLVGVALLPQMDVGASVAEAPGVRRRSGQAIQ
jgi:predicted TIM-barrel fold metal-dependent hydrolase